MSLPADPELSVLLPVRDAAPFLRGALDDLQAQREVDLEVIAVDDGSTDDSALILAEAETRWPALRVVHSPALGLPAALELGRAAARAPWLGRMDADDRCSPDRFALQLRAARSGPVTHVIGCQVEAFGDVREPMERYLAWQNGLLHHDDIVRHRFVESPLMNATAILDAAMLARVGGWDPAATWSEDLDLWCRLAEIGARFAKLPVALYRWRQHDAQATRADPRCSAVQMRACKAHYLARGPLRDRSVALWSVGHTLTSWGEALAAEGVLARPVEHRPGDDPLPEVAEGEVVVAAYGSPKVREAIDEAWTGPPDDLWFAA